MRGCAGRPATGANLRRRSVSGRVRADALAGALAAGQPRERVGRGGLAGPAAVPAHEEPSHAASELKYARMTFARGAAGDRPAHTLIPMRAPPESVINPHAREAAGLAVAVVAASAPAVTRVQSTAVKRGIRCLRSWVVGGGRPAARLLAPLGRPRVGAGQLLPQFEAVDRALRFTPAFASGRPFYAVLNGYWAPEGRRRWEAGRRQRGR